MSNQIESIFPKLSSSNYEITSPKTTSYNCIAYAADNTEKWWEPDPIMQHYWPEEAPREYTLKAYVEAYKSIGYERCKSGQFEEGVRKVAIFVDDQDNPKHAARQLSNGRWTSKLGDLEDIEHDLTDLVSQTYGKPKVFLKKPIDNN